MSKFKELSTRGWANLNASERKEYQELKAQGKQSGETLAQICTDLWKVIKDGDNRAILHYYKTIENDEPLINNLLNLMGDIKGGEDKGYINRIIQSLEHNEYLQQKNKENNPDS